MCDGVEVPTHDCLLGGPGPIYLPYFLEEYGFLTVCVLCLVGAEYSVNIVEEVPDHLAALRGFSLYNRNKVIQLDVYTICGVR